MGPHATGWRRYEARLHSGEMGLIVLIHLGGSIIVVIDGGGDGTAAVMLLEGC